MARPPPQWYHREEGGASAAAPSATTIAADDRPHGWAREANFDTNMVIILAALLSALMCALGLNSIVRCILRCTTVRPITNHHHRHGDFVAAGRGRGGLKRSTIRQIPVAVYNINNNNNMNVISTDCIICLGEFMDGEKIRVLPQCKHGFHVRCIDTWLLSHSSCPTCRHSLLEWAGNHGSGGGDGGGGGGRDNN